MLSRRSNRFGYLSVELPALNLLYVLMILACLTAQAQTYEVLHYFNGADGAHPQAGVTLDKVGNIYGTTNVGGTNGKGVVYQLATTNGQWFLTPLHSFTAGTDGQNPIARVVFGPDGGLYGVAGTTVFSLRPRPTPCPSIYCPWNKTNLYTGLSSPGTGDLIFDKAGNVYGAQSALDPCYYGCVYKLTPSHGSWTYQELYDFTNDDGNEPNGVIFDSAGNLYGTAQFGGQHNFGTVFQLTPGEPFWTETTLHTFTGNADGAYPVGLISDPAGNLFADTSTWGGDFQNPGMGTAVELGPYGQWDFSIIYTFPCGSYCLQSGGPQRSLTMDASGNLYGTQGADGSEYQHGSVFELQKTDLGYTYVSLHEFCPQGEEPCPDGDNPVSTVTIGPDGNLYGTTNVGGNAICGTFGCGVVWKITLH